MKCSDENFVLEGLQVVVREPTSKNRLSWLYMVQGNFDASLMQFLKLCSFSVYLMIVLLSVLSSLAVTYSELFWADQYIHQTHEAATMIGVDWVNFLNLHLQMFKKCTPWPCLLLDFAFSKLSELKRCRK